MLIVEKNKKWIGFKIIRAKGVVCIFCGFFILVFAKLKFNEYCDFLMKNSVNEYRKNISLKRKAEYKRKKINKK